MEILFDEPITFIGADGEPTHAPMVAGSVLGEATRFIVDTGSTDHILTKELADRVGLSAEPGEEGIDASGASVASWTLGDVRVQIGETSHTLTSVIAILRHALWRSTAKQAPANPGALIEIASLPSSLRPFWTR